jgi:hypothetical protein
MFLYSFSPNYLFYIKKKEIFLEIDGKENSVSQKVSTKQLIQSQMIALEQYTVYLFVY